MPNVTIYHNPRCSKSRQTLELLQQKNIEPTIKLYLQSPPTTAELQSLLKLLKLKPMELIRKKEAIFKELNLGNLSDDNKLIQAMVENPVLIERPIIIVDNKKAAIGRPPENILGVIS